MSFFIWTSNSDDRNNYYAIVAFLLSYFGSLKINWQVQVRSHDQPRVAFDVEIRAQNSNMSGKKFQRISEFVNNITVLHCLYIFCSMLLL